MSWGADASLVPTRGVGARAGPRGRRRDLPRGAPAEPALRLRLRLSVREPTRDGGVETFFVGPRVVALAVLGREPESASPRVELDDEAHDGRERVVGVGDDGDGPRAGRQRGHRARSGRPRRPRRDDRSFPCRVGGRRVGARLRERPHHRARVLVPVVVVAARVVAEFGPRRDGRVGGSVGSVARLVVGSVAVAGEEVPERAAVRGRLALAPRLGSHRRLDGVEVLRIIRRVVAIPRVVIRRDGRRRLRSWRRQVQLGTTTTRRRRIRTIPPALPHRDATRRASARSLRAPPPIPRPPSHTRSTTRDRKRRRRSSSSGKER